MVSVLIFIDTYDDDTPGTFFIAGGKALGNAPKEKKSLFHVEDDLRR